MLTSSFLTAALLTVSLTAPRPESPPRRASCEHWLARQTRDPRSTRDAVDLTLTTLDERCDDAPDLQKLARAAVQTQGRGVEARDAVLLSALRPRGNCPELRSAQRVSELSADCVEHLRLGRFVTARSGRPLPLAPVLLLAQIRDEVYGPAASGARYERFEADFALSAALEASAELQPPGSLTECVIALEDSKDGAQSLHGVDRFVGAVGDHCHVARELRTAAAQSARADARYRDVILAARGADAFPACWAAPALSSVSRLPSKCLEQTHLAELAAHPLADNVRPGPFLMLAELLEKVYRGNVKDPRFQHLRDSLLLNAELEGMADPDAR